MEGSRIFGEVSWSEAETRPDVRGSAQDFRELKVLFLKCVILLGTRKFM